MSRSVSSSFAIPLRHFDAKGHVKPNWAFWASVLFLLRSYAVLVAALSFRQDSSALLSLFYPQQTVLYQSLLSGIPIIIAVACVSFRETIANKALHWPFRLILPLLILGLVGDFGHYVLLAMEMHWRFSWAAAIALTGNVIVALYLFRSLLLRAFVEDWQEYALERYSQLQRSEESKLNEKSAAE